MPIKMPLNKSGKRADPDNEAHMLGVHRQANSVFITGHNAKTNQAGRDAIELKWRAVVQAGLEAEAKARAGDAYWRNAIEAGNKNILDCWDGVAVIYPQIINHANASSRYSFLLYLAHSLGLDGQVVMPNTHADLFSEIDETVNQIDTDAYWIINSISELAG